MREISQRRPLQATILLLTFSLALLVVVVMSMANATYASDLEGGLADAPTGEDASRSYSHRLIVQLESPSLAEMSAVSGMARGSNGRLAVNVSSAQAYVAQLEAEQAAFVASMQQVLNGASVATYINEVGQSVQATYQTAFNGVAVDPGSVELAVARKSLAQIPGVKAVFLDFAHEPDLYASLPLINASDLWNNPGIGGRSNGGAGVKVASMDGGAHHAAPMFDGTGFSYPTGAPFFGSGLGDMANNNGKIIVSRAYFRAWDPPDVGDENTWPGQDGTSHGTHTASTAAGNTVVADFLGITETLSGVAPGAWVMSYRVFYDSVTHDGSFYNVEGIAALEDILMDGADVLNNSWGGGPGSIGGEFDALDTALINVASAGTFVSMSAGNAGPGNGTTDHPSTDYINVAASSTSGTFSAGRLNVSEPLPISPTLQSMSFGVALFGPPLLGGQVITHSFISAASVDIGNVTGCSAWAGTPYTGNAALISRGGCSFGTKVHHAQQAGADFVVIYNNAGDGLTNMSFACDHGCSANDITISSIFIGQTNGTDMVSWYSDHGAASVLEVDMTAFQIGNTPDLIAGFSSRGPGAGSVLKPDIAAPGVNILAQGYKPGASGEERHLGFGQSSGTSMASPHVAGSAALLRQLHPAWSNAYIKSALMSTSRYMDIYNQPDGSPAQPLDMGAGVLDLTHAADPGIILSPPSLSYGLLPTGTVKSIQVWVTSVAAATETYDLSTLYTGNGFAITETTALPGFVVSPISITVAPGASTRFTVTFDSATGTGIGDNQGYVILTGDNGHEGHMPAWARVQPAPSAEVLIIDNDFSPLLSFPDYLAYYTGALNDLGLTYDVWDADANCCGATTLPEAAVLSSYQVVIYFTGDNFYPDGTFTVPTPLTPLDMDRLVEYANSGGIVIAMGQDMSAVLDDSFFDEPVLGIGYLQDSVSGFSLPNLPIVPYANAPQAFDSIVLDLGGQRWHDVALIGANEVPPVATTADGTASFAYDVTTGELSYDITINAGGVPVTLTAAHIHSGTVGVNGPVIHPITEITSTMLVSPSVSVMGSVSLSAGEETQLLTGGLYLNVHSTAHPSGQVRGQVVAALNGDGAENQYFIDEIAVDPSGDPIPSAANPYQALLAYPGPYNIEDGVVAMAHRDQPTLERPGTSYPGRSIFTSFGLEGVNDGLGSTDRDQLLGTFLDWAMDEPVVTITDVTGSYTLTNQVNVFEADLSSNIPGTTGVSYRWDFGDGSAYAGPFSSSTSSHTYDYCGVHMVRVEATDSWGNRTIGSLDVNITQQCTYMYLFPIVFKN